MRPPDWLRRLDEADVQFIKRMVLASGSLKELAAQYEVSYPTIRQRLDRIIERIRVTEDHPDDDEFESRVRILVAENSLKPTIARDLLALHRQTTQLDTEMTHD
jgi:hypothetical protein